MVSMTDRELGRLWRRGNNRNWNWQRIPPPFLHDLYTKGGGNQGRWDSRPSSNLITLSKIGIHQTPHTASYTICCLVPT